MKSFLTRKPKIPRERTLDSTVALLSEGYTFVSNRAHRFDSDIFETRLMLQKAYCMLGEEAARTFYEPGRFTRRNALPPTALTLLLDKGSVSVKDGGAHHHRKRMFMSLMSEEAITELAEAFERQWRAQIPQWRKRRKVVLHEEVQKILCRTVCAWAGVPLPESEVEQRTGEFAAMIDGAGSMGPRNWWGQLRRARAEEWIQGVVRRVRSGEIEAPEGRAAHVIATHRDPDGELLDVEVAAVELINVLRPTVAVSRFITFAALAMHEHPETRERLEEGDDAYAQWFTQEVRRFYPLFPMVGGRAQQAFEWRGHQFPKDTWMLLDLYGTNHDPRIWDAPGEFRPERFRDWDGSPFDFIPQGGGDFEKGHRCAGEWLTIALTKKATHLLTTAMRYEVPKQDLAIDLTRMPTLPKSGFLLKKVKPTPA